MLFLINIDRLQIGSTKKIQLFPLKTRKNKLVFTTSQLKEVSLILQRALL